MFRAENRFFFSKVKWSFEMLKGGEEAKNLTKEKRKMFYRHLASNFRVRDIQL